MSQLTKGMYGSQFERASKLFGLACGQLRSRDFVHNGGWYNRLGEKLGWGDLSPEDFNRIQNELEDGELFIVLRESDSFWNFVTRPSIIGSMAAVKPDMEAPGVEYVAEKCGYIINTKGLHLVTDYPTEKEYVDLRGNLFKALTREEAKQLIATANAPTPSAS